MPNGTPALNRYLLSVTIYCHVILYYIILLSGIHVVHAQIKAYDIESLMWVSA